MRRSSIYKALSFVIAFTLCFYAVTPKNARQALMSFAPAEAQSVLLRNDYRLELPEVNAESAVIIDAESRSLLFAKGESIVRGMASTTKIMTALVAIENCLPEEEFVIPAQAVGIEGSSVYLSEGEPLTLKELLYCLLLESGNDAATAIAICVGGSEEKFVEMMNLRAKELGLTSTRFANPHGLSHNDHYTTAEELAMIAAEAMEYPLFREIVSTESITVRRNGIENSRFLRNHNKLLWTYDGAVGVKTGYTEKDGKCLVSAAEKDGLLLIAVTLKDPSPRFTHEKMLNGAFDSFCKVTIAREGDISTSVPINDGEGDFATLTNGKRVEICLPKGKEFEIVLEAPTSIDAPLSAGEICGKARVLCDGREVYIINLESTETINKKEKRFWERLFGE